MNIKSENMKAYKCQVCGWCIRGNRYARGCGHACVRSAGWRVGRNQTGASDL
jgi:hypothetical protein